MARESLTVNGYDLMDGEFRDTEVVVFRSPAPVGENPTVAGRTGSVVRRKRHGPGGFRVTMWVGHPTETRAQVQARWDGLLRVVNQPHAPAAVVWTLSDSSTRTCAAELVGDTEPTAIGQRGFRAQLEFTIPAAYWFGPDGSASATGTAGTVNLTWQQAASAPLEHLEFTLTGPFTSMTVTAPSTGDSFTYSKAVAGGQSVVINSDTGEVTGAGGHTADPRLLAYTADRFLTVAPGLPGSVPQVEWTSVGGSAATGLAVAGKVAYQ